VKIAVLGSGQWGSTLAQVLLDAGNQVIIWARNKEVVSEINSSHKNRTALGEHLLPDSLYATNDINEALEGAELVVLALPSQSLRQNLELWRSLIKADIPIVSTLKGIEISTQLRMSEVICQVLHRDDSNISVLTGPNLAREVILRQPAGAVAASTNQELAELTAKAFSAPYFRVYTSNDVIGCELASAAKNVIAIAVGMSIGMGFGENTQALVITRGLNELTRLAMARGAEPLTFVGLAGVGDLLATCGSPLSRNRSFGEALGKSGSVEQAQRAISSTAEGFTTAQALVELAHLVGIEAPIMEAVCDVVTSKITPQQAFISLMRIQTGAEIDHV
jgi:glycerol-3-phosphate dehydrogenase (NAD(P)+)